MANKVTTDFMNMPLRHYIKVPLVFSCRNDNFGWFKRNQYIINWCGLGNEFDVCTKLFFNNDDSCN
jgi:hypothetical protein